MSIETRARSAAAAVNQAARNDVEVWAMLNQLHQRRGRRTTIVAVALVAFVVVVVGVGAITWSSSHRSSGAPAIGQPSPAISGFNLGLVVPFTAAQPKGWSQDMASSSVALLSSPSGPFVQVIVNPSPVATTKSPAPTTLTANSIALWLAGRAEFEPTSAVPTTVSGLPAWQVDLKVRAGVSEIGTCAGHTGPVNVCIPLFQMPGVQLPAGAAGDAVGRVILVQLPDGRTVGIALSGGISNPIAEILTVTKPVLDSLSFKLTP